MDIQTPDHHLQDHLNRSSARFTAETRYGLVTGGKADNGAIVFLEIPYALRPARFEDPEPLPDDFRYSTQDFIYESAYGVQPRNDGQATGLGLSCQDKVGLGEPTENPLFLNIHIPPSFPSKRDFPVKVYIHGGFLQFGSPHSLSSQAQYVSAERSEIWVNIGYRLSAFGFIASDRHGLSGNYGFKDQWLALKWIKSNISAFGGNTNDIQITGLSAGGHSVHQLLHHASQLPEGETAPFSSAVLQSNAMLTDPKPPSELRPQFEALCHALSLDPNAPDTLATIKSNSKVPWLSITQAIENEQFGPYGTFRGCLSDDWIKGPMERQRNGDFARGLKSRGVRYLIVGELSEEWYLYSIAHPIQTPNDIIPNLKRYFPSDIALKLISQCPPLPRNANGKEIRRRFGELLSLGQVYLPVRILARDLLANGFPVLRYEIRWTPEQLRPFGLVTHGTDRALWTLRLPALTQEQAVIARKWLDGIEAESRRLISGKVTRNPDEVFILNEDKSIGWGKDMKWEASMQLGDVVLPRSNLPDPKRLGSRL